MKTSLAACKKTFAERDTIAEKLETVDVIKIRECLEGEGYIIMKTSLLEVPF